MYHSSIDVALRVVAQLELQGAKTLLDLGGDPGPNAMVFLARYPHVRKTGCDREAALSLAKQIANTHKARKLLSYFALNFIEEGLPGP